MKKLLILGKSMMAENNFGISLRVLNDPIIYRVII